MFKNVSCCLAFYSYSGICSGSHTYTHSSLEQWLHYNMLVNKEFKYSVFVCGEISASGSVNAVQVPRGSWDTGAQPTPYARPYANRPFILHPPAGQIGTNPPPCISSQSIPPSLLPTSCFRFSFPPSFCPFHPVPVCPDMSWPQHGRRAIRVCQDHRSALTRSETAFIFMTV